MKKMSKQILFLKKYLLSMKYKCVIRQEISEKGLNSLQVCFAEFLYKSMFYTLLSGNIEH